MMTMDERVEAAARRLCEVDTLAPDPDAPIIWKGKPAKAWEARVPLVLAVDEVMRPELHGDEPTHWLAPWDLTDEILNAVIENDEFVPWAEMRDAYLGKGDGG